MLRATAPLRGVCGLRLLRSDWGSHGCVVTPAGLSGSQGHGWIRPLVRGKGGKPPASGGNGPPVKNLFRSGKPSSEESSASSLGRPESETAFENDKRRTYSLWVLGGILQMAVLALASNI